MEVSIVIVNYNTFDLVKACITSIKKFTKDISYEIIVVDNSADTTEEERFKELLPFISYINPNENLGFGRANNLGFTRARGKYILALNSDTLFIEDSLQYCLDFMKSAFAKEGNIGMIGCKLLNEDYSFQHSFFPFLNNSVWTYFKCSNPILYKLFRINNNYSEPKQFPIEVGDISGAFMFFEKKLLEKIKGFDPDFFMYCEDTEWCRERVRKAYKIYYLPSTSVIHLGGKSAPRKLMFIQNTLSLSLLWYKKGIFPYLSYLIISYINVATYACTYFLQKKEQKKTSLAYLNTYYQIFFYHFNQIPDAATHHKPLIFEQLKEILYKPSFTIK